MARNNGGQARHRRALDEDDLPVTEPLWEQRCYCETLALPYRHTLGDHGVSSTRVSTPTLAPPRVDHDRQGAKRARA